MTLLEIRDLTWIPRGEDHPVWSEVSFRVDEGELTVLAGPSGSGKSTLLRGIVGLQEITGGSRHWCGERIGADNIRRFRHRAVYVHQTPEAIAPRVVGNLAFPREIGRQVDGQTHSPMDRNDQQELLDRFGLGALDWERRFDELSVGERQRVALVRCVSVKPKMLLLDEPTASLDPENAERVEQFVLSYLEQSEDRAVVWVTHSSEQRQRLNARTIDITRWTERN